MAVDAVAARSAARPRLTLASPRTLVWLGALTFFVVHLFSLTRWLEDLDSVNFALGVREFDVARHQPHPPGYPVFIALARLGAAVFRSAGMPAPEIRGLVIWGVMAGALLIPLTFIVFRALSGRDLEAAVGALLVGSNPLVWFTAARPLSDVAGLAAAFAALAALAVAVAAPARRSGSGGALLVLGAFVAGLAVGVRSQMAVLVGPLLVLALLTPRTFFPVRVRVAAAGAGCLGVVVWAVPLLFASGGVSGYLAALSSQAGEDFSGVEMLWTRRSSRLAVAALLHTFVRPWIWPFLAGAVLALALAGTSVVARRSGRTLLLLVVVFGPYSVFHLLFQETVTVRYALPLVPAVAFLAAVALVEGGRPGVLVGALVMCLGGLHAGSAVVSYSRRPAPVFGLLDEMSLLAARGAQPLIGMHRRVATETRRAREWAGPPPGELLPTPRDYEWLELTRRWREGYEGEAWFVADPGRTDLALIDAEFRRTRQYRWPFADVYVGGARPDILDWHMYGRPGWFLERGWALTPEIAGITARDGWGPHLRPSVGWVRQREGELLLMIGGRHLGPPADPPVRVEVFLGDVPVARLVVPPGPFLHFEPLPPDRAAGQGYAPLSVRAEATEPGPVPPVALEQFNIQSADVVQFAYGPGWHEPELNPSTRRSWRWMSEAADLVIQPDSQGVRIRVLGEDPRHYYEAPPHLLLTAGDRELAELTPDGDFAFEAAVPADAVSASGGILTLRASTSFVAGERTGTADRRRLALRIYAVEVSALPATAEPRSTSRGPTQEP
ncbi:MAG TPA: DUF2723 domain-containing protein [Vicinamibacterales bacterium]|nr:DUF2723 domain-containing protein [Vicinamibacterales bacterium]